MSAATAHNHRRTAGFTLVEMIIVVGAVALIGLGVARVFEATGETVTTGRRISRLNQVLALLERRIREDVGSMSRDGFLLIRNEQVGDSRIDEIVFFGNGNFVSQREPLHPQRTATSNTARIYWGHGSVHDDEIDGIDVSGRDGESDPRLTPGAPEAGPSADWALLRHITLLMMPSQGENDDLVPDPPGNWFTNARDDNRLQIRLQPAAPSIFRVFNDDYPFEGNVEVARVDASGDGVPRFESGVIDIAATNLDEIRAFILDAQGLLDQWVSGGINVPDDRWGTLQPYSNLTGDGDSDIGSAFVPESDFTPRSTAGLMQAWMRQALPANSDGSTDGFEYNFNERRRIRCLRRPFDPFDVFEDQAPPATNINDQIRLAQRRGDEQALLASVIVPRCSSFKVEWSFGQNYDVLGDPNLRTEITWHDLEENSGPDDDNLYKDRDFNVNWRRAADNRKFKEGIVPYTRRNGDRITIPNGDAGNRTYVLNNDPWVVSDELIHGEDANNNELREPGEVAYSYFGFVDPTYPAPDTFRQHFENPGYAAAGSRVDANGNIVDRDMPPTMDWPWPRLLRFTIQVIDETEPARPQTIQFVVELPERDA